MNTAMVEAVRILYSGGFIVRILHQSGTADLAELEKAYRDMGAEAEVKAFIRKMADAYIDADLVVCRAGALTVAEIALVGLPAIFIPLPVADGHQEKNARSMEEVSAAVVIEQKDLTPQLLADRISALIQDSDRLKEMGENAATAAKPKAAEDICDICLDFLNSGSRGK